MISRGFYIAWTLMNVIAPSTAPPGVTWSSRLGVSSLSAIDGFLDRPLRHVRAAVLDDMAVRPMKTCRDVIAMVDLNFKKLSPEDNTVAWHSFQSDAVRCFALKILRDAKPASVSYLGWFGFFGSGVLMLPAGLAPSFSDREMRALARAQKGCTSWGKYDRHLKVHVQDQDADLETPGWVGHIYLYARGDLNGDGIEDLLFMRQAVMTGDGALPDSSEQLFIVSQKSKTTCARVVWTLPDLGG
jgi:hypothetical protein